MKASIVILNWNGGAEHCLESVASALAQDYPDKEILFVDNASSDGSPEAVKANYPDLVHIQTGSNLGCPAGRNVGARAASGDILFFLENDGAWATADVVSGVMDWFQRLPQLGALYTRVDGYASGKPDQPLDGPTPEHGLFLSHSFRGGASAVRRQLFVDLGCFPDDFFRQGEEGHVSLKLYDEGYLVAYWPERIMRHKGSDYPGKSAAVFRYYFENTMKTLIRLYPLSYAWRIGLLKYLRYAYLFARRGRLTEFVAVNRELWAAIRQSSSERPVRPQVIDLAEHLRSGELKINLQQTPVDTESLLASIKPARHFLKSLQRIFANGR